MTSVNTIESSKMSIDSHHFSSPPLNQLLNQVTTIKLDRGNFLLWKNLALPILRSYKLEGHLLGTKLCPPMVVKETAEEVLADEVTPSASSSEMASRGDPSSKEVINPQYEAWQVVDQLLLGWLYNSMSPEVATQVMGYDNSKDLWKAIQDLFGVQSRAEEDFLRQTFQQSRKGNLKMGDYLRTMKSHADNLGQAGSTVSTRSLVSQVLLGLDEEFNPIVATLQARADISWSQLQAELLVFEKRLEFQNTHKTTVAFSHNASVNMANNRSSSNLWGQNQNRGIGGTNFNNGSNATNGQRNNNNNNRGRGRGRGYGNANNRPICQVCGKIGHNASVCYHRFNKDYVPNMNRGNNNPQNGNHGNPPNGNNPGAPPPPAAFLANQQTFGHGSSSEIGTDANWYADSGASNHVTADFNNLASPAEYGGQGYGAQLTERSA